MIKKIIYPFVYFGLLIVNKNFRNLRKNVKWIKNISFMFLILFVLSGLGFGIYKAVDAISTDVYEVSNNNNHNIGSEFNNKKSLEEEFLFLDKRDVGLDKRDVGFPSVLADNIVLLKDIMTCLLFFLGLVFIARGFIGVYSLAADTGDFCISTCVVYSVFGYLLIFIVIYF